MKEHPLAIAWKQWCEKNPECLTLSGMPHGEYLKNRLWKAFMDGAEAQEYIDGRKRRLEAKP